MKTLTGRRFEIASGLSSLPNATVSKYRDMWERQGYELPPYQQGRRIKSRNTTPRQLPGTELTKLLAWVEKIKPANATCSCKTLASEMDSDGVAKCRQRRDSYYLPKMLQNKSAITEVMRAEGGLLGVAGFVGGLVPDAIALPWLRSKFDAACDAAERQPVTRKPQVRRQKSRGYRSAFRNHGTPRFVTSAQLQNDIKTLVSKVPSDITAIAGVARSGLSVATMVSMYLHLPMITIRQTANDIVDTGNGWRLGQHKHLEPQRKKVLVVDDTVMTGNSLRAIKPLLDKELGEYLTAAVYVNPLAVKKPDIYAVDLGWPHLLEWNLFNSVLSPNMACDFDGILCRDCQPGQDDDGPRYLDFIRNAQPLYLPRKVPIPLIVTARVEKYRAETMAWLDRHGVRCNRLVMHPAATTRERERDNIAAWKARHFGQWAARHKASPPPLAFIESDDRQAQAIARITKKMVICPATAGVYQ